LSEKLADTIRRPGKGRNMPPHTLTPTHTAKIDILRDVWKKEDEEDHRWIMRAKKWVDVALGAASWAIGRAAPPARRILVVHWFSFYFFCCFPCPEDTK